MVIVNTLSKSVTVCNIMLQKESAKFHILILLQIHYLIHFSQTATTQQGKYVNYFMVS